MRCSNDYTPPLLSSLFSRNSCFDLQFWTKTKITTQLCMIIYLALPFPGLCLGFHVFVQDFNDIFQIEDWFSLRQQMPVMTLAKVSHTGNKCAIGSNVLPSLLSPPLSVCSCVVSRYWGLVWNQISSERTERALKQLDGSNQEEIKCW